MIRLLSIRSRFSVPAFLRDTANGTVFNDTGNPFWSDTRVLCLPGNTTTPGSSNITVAEKAAASGAGRVGASLGAVVRLAVLVGSFV